MIKLSDGELLDLLPSPLKNDVDMVCLSHALKAAMDTFREYELHSMTQNFIDMLPDNILDVLAVELRSPYYRQDMDIDTKRSIIKNTLIWHTKAGTPSAVAEMAEVLFGSGRVVEWYDFDEGEKIPGTFDIVTSARMTEHILEDLLEVIDRVKNERSHLRRVLIERKIKASPHVGVGLVTYPNMSVLNGIDPSVGIETQAAGYKTAAAVSYPDITIVGQHETPDTEIHARPKSGNAGVSWSNIVIK